MKTIYLFILGILFTATNTFAQLKPVKYADGNQILNGLSIKAVKKSSQNPGILLLPAWKGIDNASKEIAENLSKLGYTVFIADIYGEGNYPKEDSRGARRRPDIIVHERGHDIRNLLVIEVKPAWGNSNLMEEDRDNLRRMLLPPRSYQYAFFILYQDAPSVRIWAEEVK